MASAAEQMAANISWSTLGKATELRQRIFFTVGLLIVYRIGTYIPVWKGVSDLANCGFDLDVEMGMESNIFYNQVTGF